MNKEQILETLTPLPTETKVKAWIFQVEKDFYHIAEYGGVYRVPAATSIWKSNKKGKRMSENPIFKINQQNHMLCIEQFLNSLEEKEIEKEIEKESKN